MSQRIIKTVQIICFWEIFVITFTSLQHKEGNAIEMTQLIHFKKQTKVVKDFYLFLISKAGRKRIWVTAELPVILFRA